PSRPFVPHVPNCLGQIPPVHPIRPVRVLTAQMSHLLPDCLFSFCLNRPVRVLR
ncbi:hypothetical protein KI387_019375, partial [Taxus chinensis]